ncbi:type II secretion system GspH family protein [Pendulispora rubella]|uniref:Type II secretion system GspH family protein n=1 Tax=Pendulispora rubella TaxID=2741070 RepID=A0ABZ2L3M2_9BACT
MHRIISSRCRVHSIRRGARGVTLIEILVVLAILSLISGIVGFHVLNEYIRAQIVATEQNAKALRNLVVAYRLTGPDACPSVETLRQFSIIDAASKTTDAWDQSFLIVCEEAGEIRVSSAGPDRKHGTPDDIQAPPDLRLAADR